MAIVGPLRLRGKVSVTGTLKAWEPLGQDGWGSGFVKDNSW